MPIDATFTEHGDAVRVVTAAPWKMVGEAMFVGINSRWAVTQVLKFVEALMSGDQLAAGNNTLPRTSILDNDFVHYWEFTATHARITREVGESATISVSISDFCDLLTRLYDYLLDGDRRVWQTAGVPNPLLDRLGPTTSARKLRLFACACARALAPWMVDSRSRAMIDHAEEYADGVMTSELLRRTAEAAKEPLLSWPLDAAVYGLSEKTFERLSYRLAAQVAAMLGTIGPIDFRAFTLQRYYWPEEVGGEWLAFIEWLTALEGMLHAQQHPPEALVARYTTLMGSLHIYFVARARREANARAALWRGQRQSAYLLRDVFGDPFRALTLDPALLRWRDGTIPRIAATIYQERRFDEMPVLGDALEEAGCLHVELLDHCRAPGEHVRGCWVLDLVRSVD